MGRHLTKGKVLNFQVAKYKKNILLTAKNYLIKDNYFFEGCTKNKNFKNHHTAIF